LEATITLEYSNSRIAEAVSTAISPDNFKTPKGLLVETVQSQKQVITKVRSDRKLATLIATLDDLLFSAATAEKTIGTIKKARKRLAENPKEDRSKNTFFFNVNDSGPGTLYI
jgi:hypothetical protein